MTIYNAILADAIKNEIAFKDLIFNKKDKNTLQKMLKEINNNNFTNYNFLAEIIYGSYKNTGSIIKKYISEFISQGTRGYLSLAMASDVKDCDRLLLDLYMDFKHSNEYISSSNQPSSAYIYVRYDNAFLKQKSKRIKTELFHLISNPRDAFYLPLTVKMLSSWKMKEMKPLLLTYLNSKIIKPNELNFSQNNNKNYYPTYDFIIKQLQLNSINCLKYYPCNEVANKLYMAMQNKDEDNIQLISEVYTFIEKKLKKSNTEGGSIG